MKSIFVCAKKDNMRHFMKIKTKQVENILIQWELIQVASESCTHPILLNRDDEFIHSILRDNVGQNVTNIVVTNKGAGYTSGATSISIVYPGSGAIFETKLTELTYNEAATYEELGLASNQFTNRKTTDIGGGGVFKGENDLLYGGELTLIHI